jgi:MFS family permease
MQNGDADPARTGLAVPGRTTGRVIVALVVGQLGLHAAMSGLRLAASLQVLREGASAWSVGLLLALFAAAPVLTALHAGRLADRRGYHRPVHLAVAVTVAGMLLAVLSTFVEGGWRFALLCAAAACAGTGANTGMLTIQRTAGVEARDATERVRVFSWLGIAPSFANVIGPVGVGFMIDALGIRAGYLMLLVLPLATLVSARAVPRRAAGAPAAPDEARRAWDLLRAPGLARLLTVNWLLAACWDVHAFAVPVLGHDRGYSASTIGLILGTFTLAVSGVRLVIPFIAHGLAALGVLRGAMLGTALVFAAYPFAPNAWLMGLLAALLGLTLGSVQPMIMTMLHQLTPEQRHGEALALRSMAMHASSTVMPLVFGATGTLVGAGLLFWAVGGAVGAGSWLASRLGAALARSAP